MRHLIWLEMIVIAAIGDAAGAVAKSMERAFWRSAVRLKAVEDRGGAHEPRYIQRDIGELYER